MIKIISVVDDDDIPDQIANDVIYKVGLPDNNWLAVMNCPCCCGAKLELNLLTDSYSPRWTLVESTNGGATLSPSVNRIVGCKSHFFLRGGEIIWC